MERGPGGEVSPLHPHHSHPNIDPPMNFRLTAVLFAVVLALVVGLLLYAVFSADPEVQTGGPFAALTAAGVKADDVTALEISRTSPREETLVFEKKGGKWRMTKPEGGVDSAAVEGLVAAVLALKPTEYGGPVERATTGLTKPEVTLTLRAGDRSAAVHVGNTTFGPDKAAVTFLVSATDPDVRPMAVPTRGLRGTLFRLEAKDGPPATMVKWRTDFRPARLVAADGRDVEADTEAVSVSRADKTLTLARKGDGWRITAPDLGPADVSGATDPDPARFTGVRPLLNSVMLLQTNSSADVTEEVKTADLGKYGLADADQPLKVTLTPKGQPAQTLFIGKRLTDKDNKPLVPARHYVRLAGDEAVFAVTTDAADKLANTLTDPTSLQNRDLIPPSKLTDIDAVDSSVGGGFKLRRLEGGTNPWGVYGGGGEPAEAQMQAVQSMLNKLAAPRVAAAVLPKPDNTAFDAANLQAELKVWFKGVDRAQAKLADGKLPPEPPVSGEPVTLRIGRQFVKKVTNPDGAAEDRTFVVVRRITGTEAFDLEVPLDAVVSAMQPRIKFVSARPPSFVPTQATGLVLFRDGKREEWVKNPAATDPAYPLGVWNAGDPKGPVADADGILSLLTRLASLPATLVLEKADDLKPLGLDPANPKMSATVTLPADKGGTRTEAYHFGEAVKGDDKSVYFKAVDKPFVYSLPAEVAARIRTADLTDKVAFRLDPTRVKTVIARGWANTTADKNPAKVAAERQNGTWVGVDESKGAAVNAAVLDAWLDALRFPKSVGPAAVEPGKEPPAAYGLGFEAIKLLIVSKAEKAGDPDVGLDLAIGAYNADKTGVYARLSDGRVFLLDAQPFRALLERSPLGK
jgi:hypothetical protein